MKMSTCCILSGDKLIVGYRDGMADTLTLDSTVYTCTVGECFLYLINVNSSDQNELAGALTLTGASSTFVVLTIPAIAFFKAT